MRENPDNSKLIVKHVHQSNDKPSRQAKLNQQMEKVIIRHLKANKLAS